MSNSIKFKRTRLSTAVAAAAVGICAVNNPAFSQQEGGAEVNSGRALEEIVVTGIRGSLQRAVDVKRNAGGVVDSISAEGIGKFPDANIAESLQRISGVSIDRSGGEGQSVTVRGFGPSFNTVAINGRRLASESETRGFSFDTLASELVSGLDVHKTAVASLPSGGVGSTVNVRTARPFDTPGLQLSGSVAYNYEENSDDATPQFSGLISNTFADDTLGVLLSVSRQERDARTNQAQTDQWIENPAVDPSQLISGPTPLFAPQNFDQRVLFSERERTNVNLVGQYAPSDSLTVTGEVLYSEFDIQTSATSVGHWFTPNNYENVVTDENGTVVSFDQPTGQATDFHSRTFDRLTDTTSYGLNFDWQVNDSLNLDFDLWYSEANRDANNGNSDNVVLGYLRGASYDNTSGDLFPTVSGFREAATGLPEPDGSGRTYDAGNFLDPSNPRAHVSIRGGQVGGAEIVDEITELKFNGIWDEGGDTGIVRAKFGISYAEEEREINRFDNTTSGTHAILAGYFAPDFTTTFNGQTISNFDIPDSIFSVFDAGDDFLSSVRGNVNIPTQFLRFDAEEVFDLFEQETGISFDAVRTGASFVVEEEVTSLYLDFDVEGSIADMPLSATMGFRYEETDVTVNGTDTPLESLNILDQTEFGRVFQPATPVQANFDYDVLLPSISAKLEISDNWIARAAASQTITRPTLTDLTPVTNIVTTRPGGNLTARSGNSELVPFESDNLDLSFEYYYGDSSYVSVGWFKKNVDNFITNVAQVTTFTNSAGETILDPLTNEPAAFTVTLPGNSETIEVDGFELAFQHNFANGFGIIFNATLVDSDVEFDVFDTTQTFALPGLSDTLNLVGFYEKGPYQIRLAYNQRDSFLSSLVQSAGAEEPVFTDEFEQWDLSASYHINDRTTVFFEGINLTEEEVIQRGRFSNQFLSVDDTGRRFRIGIRASY